MSSKRCAATRPEVVALDSGAPPELGGTSIIQEARRIAAFIAVAEELHYGRAAQRLAISQSPLSRLIIHLEGDLGFALFARNRRGVRLTAAGEAFLVEGRQILARLQIAIFHGRALAVQDDVNFERRGASSSTRASLVSKK